MSDTLQSVLIGAASGLLSAWVTYLSTRSRIRLELAAEYDKDLRQKRLSAYEALWAMLAPLARYGRTEPITYAVLRSISSSSRDWYFKAGGILLTQSSREPYFSWKEAMQPILDESKHQQHPNEPLDSILVDVIQAASALRTSLSDDIGTKRQTLI